MQIFHRQTFILVFFSHLFLLSLQSRAERWNQLSHWRFPNGFVSNIDKDNSEECSVNDSGKCTKGVNNFEKLLFDELVQNNNLIEDTDLKHEQSKRYPSGNPPVISPTLNVVDEGRSLLFKSARLPTCNCDVRYEFSDLGHDYYPRYVPSAVCTMQVCWNSLYRCQPKYYKMYFLKRRNGSIEEIIDSQHKPLLPESLRKEWVFEPISVAVSCECLP